MKKQRGFVHTLVIASSFILPVANASAIEAILLGKKFNTSVAGGIANPSSTSALGENPAGLVNNERSKIQGAVAAGNTQFDPLGYGIGFFSGNGTVGGGLQLQGFNQTAGAAGNVVLLNWGLAAYLKGLNMAFGFTGTRTIDSSGEVQGTGTGTTWCVDAGFIFNPRARTRFGVSFFQLLNNIDAIGAGVAYDASSNATLVVDAAQNPKNGSGRLKPGVKIHLQNFELASSFGFNYAGSGWAWINNGLSLGVTAHFANRNWALQMYFNKIAEYYLGTIIRL